MNWKRNGRSSTRRRGLAVSRGMNDRFFVAKGTVPPQIGKPRRNKAGSGGPAFFRLSLSTVRHVKGRCGTPLRSVSSLAFGAP